MSISGQPQQGSGAGAPNDSTQHHIKGLADAAGATLNDAAGQGEAQFEQLRERATEQIDSLAEGAHSAASALEGKDALGISSYLGQLADGLGAFADRVRDKSAEDLLHEGARLARDNPALFVAGSVAIGFGLSRFLRASAEHGSEAQTDHSPSASATSFSSAPTATPAGTTTSSSSFTNGEAGLTAGTASDPLLDSDVRGI